MSFGRDYQRAVRTTVKTDGQIFIPPGYEGEKSIIIPDEIVLFCVGKFGLDRPSIRVLDPMCGVGTIPRVLLAHGVDCVGVEIDDEKYIAASSVIDEAHLFHGDFRVVGLPTHSFDCIFTSLPFAWFRDKRAAAQVSPDYAQRFRDLLRPGGGFVLLDSLPRVDRDGGAWPVAELQAGYLINNGFAIGKVVAFSNASHVDADECSVIMKFNLK
jgi:SAM-dependent methyltransferase